MSVSEPTTTSDLLRAATTDAVPEWFARGRTLREVRAAAAVVLPNRAEPPTAVGRWLTGYTVSLVVHGLILLAGSAVAIGVTDRSGGPLDTTVGLADGDALQPLDARAFEIAAASAPDPQPAPVAPPVTPDLKLPPLMPAAPAFAESAGDPDAAGADDHTAEGTGDANGPESQAGANAVHQGSFAAWTVPADPRPRQDYTIIIEVTLPGNEKNTTANRYSRDDLAGLVVGSDGYMVRLPDGRERNGEAWTRPRRLPAFRIRDGKARLLVYVRGAQQQSVIDTIVIRSRLLDEEQKLQIVF